jgi:hypothetical protein
MTSAPPSGTLVTILPCNDLDASERFYNRLGFVRRVEWETRITEYYLAAQADIST